MLAGTLTDFSLPDIIQLISSGRRNGRLVIRSDGREGSIYFIEGEIVHAILEDIKGEEAVYRLFDFFEGDFEFENDISTDKRTVSTRNDRLIFSGIRRIDEWRELRKEIPSLEAVPRFAPLVGGRSSEVSLRPAEWKNLALIDGKRTVRQIAKESGYGDLETCRIMYKLISLGLIKIEKP